ncbi:MAG: hypothetical protein JWP61_37 [Friedmanniella sp.]|nr:hypothetical protein [Friedmanniella sp.]
MLWVWVFVGIAFVGLVMLVGYGVWLAHKLSDVTGEVGVLLDRTGELADLLGQIELPQAGVPDRDGPGAAAAQAGDPAPRDIG